MVDENLEILEDNYQKEFADWNGVF